MKMVLLLCSFPAEFMDYLEEHYGKYRHTEAALGVHNMTDETLRPGTKRYKVNHDTCWSEILTVIPEAVQRNVTLCALERYMCSKCRTQAQPSRYQYKLYS